MKPNLRTIILLAATIFSFSIGQAYGEEEELSFDLMDFEREFRELNAANDLADNSAQIIVCTKTGRMIISTIGNLNFYDGTSFSHIDTHVDYQFHLPLYRGNYHLYFDHYHHIWLKNTNTVTCVDMMMERFIPDPEHVFKELGCTEPVQDLFTDEVGQLWLLTEKGLYGVDQKQYYQVMKDRNLQDVEVYENMLYTFYDNGEEVGMDLTTGRIAHRTRAYEWADAEQYTSSSTLLHYNSSFYQIRNGERSSVLLHFDIKTQTWTKLLAVPYHLNNIAIHNDLLFIASEYGYWVHDIKTGEQKHVENLKITGTDRVLNTDCNTISFDKQGGMWIGTEKRGVLYARPLASPFKAYTWDQPQAMKYVTMMQYQHQNITEFNGKQANCMYTDSRNWSWFGTSTGLYLYRTPKSDPEVFNKKNGLFNEVVHAVVEDKNHNIWLSTSCGISCILLEGDKVVFVNSYNADDNVPNESFVNCKAICLDDGTIAMQAIDHVVVFDPDKFKIMNSRMPLKFYPKLIKIAVNGFTVKPGMDYDGNVIIDRAISRVKEINLNSDQNSVSLTFSGLNYFRPLQTYYRVRLKGLDDEWRVYSYFYGSENIDADGRLHLVLVGLEPGDFDIEIQASMFPDLWPGEPYVWAIHVNQPWWQTTGIYIILLLLVLGLLVVNFIIYNKNTRMRMQRNNQENDVIRRVNSFVKRCDTFGSEPLVPSLDNVYDIERTGGSEGLSQEFIGLMMKLIPYIHEHEDEEITLHKLSKAAGTDVMTLYDITSANLYKSPRDLVLQIRLIKAGELLRTTEKTIGEVSDECGFDSPNYFMGCFFHHYKVTPQEYRDE